MCVGTDTAPDPWVKMGGVRLNWGVPYVMGFERLGYSIVVDNDRLRLWCPICVSTLPSFPFGTHRVTLIIILSE